MAGMEAASASWLSGVEIRPKPSWQAISLKAHVTNPQHLLLNLLSCKKIRFFPGHVETCWNEVELLWNAWTKHLTPISVRPDRLSSPYSRLDLVNRLEDSIRSLCLPEVLGLSYKQMWNMSLYIDPKMFISFEGWHLILGPHCRYSESQGGVPWSHWIVYTRRKCPFKNWQYRKVFHKRAQSESGG